jgi:hypothetical protein
MNEAHVELVAVVVFISFSSPTAIATAGRPVTKMNHRSDRAMVVEAGTDELTVEISAQTKVSGY